ncbi:MAG: 4Fe-4S double cluster binding domain-containing protein [Eubacteriales bacterium]
MTNNDIVFNLAKKYGFDECAIISAEPFYKYKEHLDYRNYGDDFEIQYDPKEYWAKSKYIITLIKSYNPYKHESFSNDHIYVDAYYVTGNESYFKAKQMSQEIEEMSHAAKYSPRIPYRHCAFRAGLGIRGMNGLLVNEKYGSYMHIQCILTDMHLEITSDNDEVNVCSNCENCVQHCKGRAIDGTGRVDMKSCIRHYMPAKRYVPVHVREMVGNSFIGCTDCRTSCPYNRKIENIEPPSDLLEACYIPTLLDKENTDYKKHFDTLQRYLGVNEVRPLKLLKAVVIAAGNTGDGKYIKMLEKVKNHSTDSQLLEYIDWAIDRIS